ncbi:hypothetical protein DAPPUDRAFT_42841 [Daphnia pulex]|uniref:Alpha-1,4 glucan phosphorylase n=1 Tax=Daphnia pulex TaxID=6669 RepID=E9FYI2_DAPPU|nr:hypothetical protein DAPPUDRAFT_50585 [Daphnia pulex]EFX87533.1 hypothetical protein DAPPUDRAFT_42841 [Daphnia pulex]|eukprot:EFX80949.1 hypothetical protein DAPPUDRAFT_50585 [Daphnia pulex]
MKPYTGKLLFKTKASLLNINLSFFSWNRVTWDFQARERGNNAFDYYNVNAELKQVIDQIASGFFRPNNPEEFRDIYNNLMYHDCFFCLADYDDYMAAQERVNEAYKDQSVWMKMCIHNIASSGKFSSDRTIAEYAREIWDVEPTWDKLPAPHEPIEEG